MRTIVRPALEADLPDVMELLALKAEFDGCRDALAATEGRLRQAFRKTSVDPSILLREWRHTFCASSKYRSAWHADRKIGNREPARPAGGVIPLLRGVACMVVNRSRICQRTALVLGALLGLLTAAGRGDEPKSTGWVESSKEEPAKTHYRTFFSDATRTDVSYLVYLPPGYDDDKDKRYPVIYWLHGMTQDQREGADFVRRLDRAVRDDKVPRAIAVLVNGRTHSYYCDSPDGKTPVESMIVKDLVPHVERTYRTRAQARDRALEGYSMGGFGAAHLGLKYPETFGLVTILAGALHKAERFSEEHSRAYREAFGADRRYFEKNSPWSLAEENASKVRGRTRFRVIAGTLDPLYDGNRDFARHLEKQDLRVEFLSVKGATHNPYDPLYKGLGDRVFQFYTNAWGSGRADE